MRLALVLLALVLGACAKKEPKSEVRVLRIGADSVLVELTLRDSTDTDTLGLVLPLPAVTP